MPCLYPGCRFIHSDFEVVHAHEREAHPEFMAAFQEIARRIVAEEGGLVEDQELRDRFRFHPATTPERQNVHQAVRGALGATAELMNDALPDCREKSLVFTKLEEAMFWANAAIARQPDEMEIPSTT